MAFIASSRVVVKQNVQVLKVMFQPPSVLVICADVGHLSIPVGHQTSLTWKSRQIAEISVPIWVLVFPRF